MARRASVRVRRSRSGLRPPCRLRPGRGVSRPGRISLSAAYQLVAQAAVLGLSLVSSPIIVHGLGLEAYGLLLIVGIATNYFGFVELGLGRAAVQLLGGHRARGEDADFRSVLWTAT